MGRRELREQIFLLLFRTEFHEIALMPEQMQLFFAEEEPSRSEQDIRYISEKVENIIQRLSQIDEVLVEKTENWKLDRVGKVELTLLRLALYEMKYDEDVPVSVAINEAVELAKKYGQDSSGAFVNAVLAKFAKSG